MEHFFDTREEASIAAANYIGDAVNRRLELQPEASLVVSGGTSPVQCLKTLSASDVAWQKVHVLLSDERWVAVDSEDSNERLVRETLLQGNAAEARLHPMHS
ncbi:MAG: 6-phosphogluconolactonase, partial [Gammaproteobacteria bacterium]|nr:6-phosphogluconolactonase [Gammaproteobacteria bacterium]